VPLGRAIPTGDEERLAAAEAELERIAAALDALAA